MKKILLLAIAILCILHYSNGQSDKLTIGLGIGAAAAFAKDFDGTKESGFGGNFFINGLYNISEKFSMGLEFNGNASLLFGSGNSAFDIKATVINGILAKMKYSFGGYSVKPFAGLMLGAYIIKPGEVSFTFLLIPVELELERKTTFGFAPEFGIEFGVLQLSTTLHFPGIYKSEIPDGNGGIRSIETKYTVWQFNLGWNLGMGDN